MIAGAGAGAASELLAMPEARTAKEATLRATETAERQSRGQGNTVPLGLYISQFTKEIAWFKSKSFSGSCENRLFLKKEEGRAEV